MSLLFWKKLFGRKSPASSQTIQCCLDVAEEGKTYLDGLKTDGESFCGLYLKDTDEEIVLRKDDQFIGIKKSEIATIAIRREKKAALNTHFEPDETQKESVDALRQLPSIDPQFDLSIFKSADVSDIKTINTLQLIFSRNKWICFYDGKRLRSDNLPLNISIPKNIATTFLGRGYYLCKIYPLKGKMPPILVLANAQYITKEVVTSIQGKATKEEAPHSTFSLDQMQNFFQSDTPYKLSVVGDIIKLSGIDISAYGHTKLLDLFTSIQDDRLEIKLDESGLPIVTFHWNKNVNVFSGKDEAWRSFLSVFIKTCEYNQDYPLATLTPTLRNNGFDFKEFGFSKMLSCLESFPKDAIVISSDSNGHPLIKVIENDYNLENISNKTDDGDADTHSILPRRGLISAYYFTRKMGFLIESPSNQTWWFNDSLVCDQQLMQSLHDGNIGQHVVFDGEDTVVEGKSYPAVSQIKSFSNVVHNPQQSSMITPEDVICTPDIPSCLSRYSKFAVQQINSCSYEGIDARKLRTKIFTEDDIKRVTIRLEKLRRSGYTPGELSKYHLTLASLHSKVDQDEVAIAQQLSSYFRLLSESCLVDQNIPGDVARFYTVEAMRVSSAGFDSASKKLIYLLFLTYAPSFGTPKGEKSSEDILALVNKIATTPFFKDLKSELPYFKEEVPHFFPDIHRELGSVIDIAEENLPSDNIRWKMILPLCENINSISGAVLTQTRDAIIPLSENLSVFDQQRFKSFLEIFTSLIDYSQKRFFSDKEVIKLQIGQIISAFFHEYNLKPTALLAEALIPALIHIKKLLDADFLALQNIMPELTVENVLETDGYCLTPEGTVELKLSICNLRESSAPIESIELSLQDRNCQESYYPGILGGSQKQKEMQLIFTPTPEEISDKAFSVNVMVSFRTRNGEKQAGPFPISVQLEKSHFEPISNPYLSYAGGNPIEASDSKMFFGRGALVHEICEQLSRPYSGQCFVLYGQKRSGKTSVMRQIQNYLPADSFYTQISAQAFNYDQSILLSTFAKHILDKVFDVAEDKSLDFPSLPSYEFANSDPVLALKQISRILKKNGLNWIVSVDEFTYIYSNAKESAETFMHAWKALLQAHVFNALIIGQDTMPQFKEAFPNDFCVSHDRRLNFLSEEDSAALASEPITKDGDSRYRGNSLTKIYQKTAGSPFFLQKLCSEIVKFLNKKGSSYITEADIDIISDNLVHGRGDSALHKEDFEALVVAGDPLLSPVPINVLWNVLATIALHSAKGAWCSFSDIASIPNSKEAIVDLQKRDTILVDNDKIKIRVELFADWLRINNKGIIDE